MKKCGKMCKSEKECFFILAAFSFCGEELLLFYILYLSLSLSSLLNSLSLSSLIRFLAYRSSPENGSTVGGSGGGDPVMDPHGGRAVAAAALNEGPSSAIAPELDEEAMWQMNLRENETLQYPERPGEPDCAYYIRTGLCRFGMTCKFNHPANRRLAAVARIKGGYPERPGQPACLYFLRTGDCKFGATCKFHHPKDKAGIAGRVQLNIIGYPLRPNEKECAYYLRTGLCKFGNTCKFHHPEPSNAMISARGSPVYPPVHSPTTPGQQSYAGGLANWPLSRASFIPSPRWQGPSSYAQLILPQGLVQVSSWNPYSGQLSSVSSPENQQQTPVTAQIYNTSRQNEKTTGSHGYLSYRPGAVSTSLYTMQRENVFPERPDQPECQFYMKTGDCKFGTTCKFHHPRDRLIPIPNCVLSPLGLPLRLGEPLCLFYSRYGICKFGPNCKFDHPVGTLTYSPTTSSAAADIPAVRRLMGSSSGAPILTLSSEGPTEAGSGKSRRLSLSEPHQMTGADENIEAEGSHVTSSIGQVTSFS